MRKILFLGLTCVLVSCDGSDDKKEPQEGDDIVGEWVTNFVRNDETFEQFLIITDSTIDTYEVGNGYVMEEWYSGLDPDTSYIFSIDGENEYILDGNEIIVFYSDAITSTARITEEVSGLEISSWEIGTSHPSQEERISFIASGDQIVFMYGAEQITYSRVD